MTNIPNFHVPDSSFLYASIYAYHHSQSFNAGNNKANLQPTERQSKSKKTKKALWVITHTRWGV